MHNNITAYKHPTIVRKIRLAALRSFMVARKHNIRTKTYVANRKGNNILRIDYCPYDAQFIVYGDQSRNITTMITPLLIDIHLIKEVE